MSTPAANAFDDLPPGSDVASVQAIANGPKSNAFDDITPSTARPKTTAPKYSPLDGMNWAERGLAGMGSAFQHTLIEGPQQAYYRLTGQNDKADAIGQQVADERRLEQPLLADTAGGAGNTLGSLAPYALGPEGAIAGGAFSAGTGALQPVAPGDSRLVNALSGAAGSLVGSGVTAGLGLVAQPVKNALSDAGKAAVQKLTDAGVPLDIAQRTGSEFLQRIKSGLASLPVTAGWVKDSAAEQKNAFTIAALKTIGADGESASPAVMSQAKSDIGDVFNESAARGAQYDPQLENDLQAVQAKMTRTVPASSHGPINTQINDILDSAAQNGGQIDGSVLQRVHSDLGDLSQNRDVGGVASDMRRALVDAQSRASTPEQQAALTEARIQYRNMKQIVPAIRDEQVSPKLLAAVQRQKRNVNQSVFGEGDQELPELAKAGASVLPETLGDSGTAGRHGALATIGAGGAIAAPLIYSAGHSTLSGEPMDWGSAGRASAEVAGALLAAKGAKGAFTSPIVSNYLVNGIGGAPTSGVAARAVRAALTAPEKSQLLANALRGAGAGALRPAGTPALPAPAPQ